MEPEIGFSHQLSTSKEKWQVQYTLLCNTSSHALWLTTCRLCAFNQTESKIVTIKLHQVFVLVIHALLYYPFQRPWVFGQDSAKPCTVNFRFVVKLRSSSYDLEWPFAFVIGQPTCNPPHRLLVLCFAGWLSECCKPHCTKQYSVVQCRVFSPQSMHFPIVWITLQLAA